MLSSLRILLITFVFLVTSLSSAFGRVDANPAIVHRPSAILVADSGIGHFALREEILGVWELIPYPPEIQAKVNKVNPWPARFQYFVILGDGRITWMMTNQKPEGLNEKSLIETFKQLPGWNHFDFKNGFIEITYPDIPGLKELWSTQIITKFMTPMGLEHRPGDMLMSLDDGHGGVIYRRLLRRMPE